MFSIGDTVCYPMNGVCKIEAIETLSVQGESAEYYVLYLNNDRTKAMVPVDRAASIGLRKIIDADECNKIIEYYSTAVPDLGSSNWNQRFRDNSAKLHSGNLRQIVDVILSLTARNTSRSLSSSENRMFNSAWTMLVCELSVVMERSEEEITAMLEPRLNEIKGK